MTLFYKLAIFMGLIVVISNFLVQYPVHYLGLEEILTYGAFSYPVTFLITDLANKSLWQNSSSKNCLHRIFSWGYFHFISFD